MGVTERIEEVPLAGVKIGLGCAAQGVDVAVGMIDLGPPAVAAVTEEVALAGEHVPVVGVMPDPGEVEISRSHRLLGGRGRGFR